MPKINNETDLEYKSTVIDIKSASSGDVMQPIPKTFCPAKWDEIMINPSYDYIFSCCKATPAKFKDGDYNLVLNKQKENLLHDIQDPSCNYCWKVENNNLPSRRHEYLKSFDYKKFDLYKANKIHPTIIELYIGNECNFQCSYCNPKFSSQWEADVKQKSYQIFTDRYFYGVDQKTQQIKDQILDIVRTLNSSSQLNILGGEPLLNKLFWQILETTNATNFFISTNLSCKTKKEIDQLIDSSSKFENMHINVSIDSTHANAEFTRYGLNFQKFTENLDYLLENATARMNINISSVMSSITIRDLNNFLNFVKEKKKKYQILTWSIFPCVQPRIQSFDTLLDVHKAEALIIIDEIQNLEYALGVDLVKSALLSSKFNNTLYSELKHFLNEFAKRKNIKIPVCLK